MEKAAVAAVARAAAVDEELESAEEAWQWEATVEAEATSAEVAASVAMAVAMIVARSAKRRPEARARAAGCAASVVCQATRARTAPIRRADSRFTAAPLGQSAVIERSCHSSTVGDACMHQKQSTFHLARARRS